MLQHVQQRDELTGPGPRVVHRIEGAAEHLRVSASHRVSDPVVERAGIAVCYAPSGEAPLYARPQRRDAEGQRDGLIGLGARLQRPAVSWGAAEQLDLCCGPELHEVCRPVQVERPKIGSKDAVSAQVLLRYVRAEDADSIAVFEPRGEFGAAVGVRQRGIQTGVEPLRHREKQLARSDVTGCIHTDACTTARGCDGDWSEHTTFTRCPPEEAVVTAQAEARGQTHYDCQRLTHELAATRRTHAQRQRRGGRTLSGSDAADARTLQGQGAPSWQQSLPMARAVSLPVVGAPRLVSLPSVEAPRPLFNPANDVVVVLSRCFEKSPTPLELLSRNVPFVVYQKMEGKCNTTVSLAQLRRDHGQHALRVRWMNHNRGDECSAYLQFIVDHYSALPRAVAFLQYDSRHQMLNYHSSKRVQRAGTFFGSIANALVAVQAHRMNMSRGFIALGRHSFEGEWPGPCEPMTRASRFLGCSAPIAQHVLGRNASGFLRFYGNGKHCICTACALHVYCVCTACALHVHCMCMCTAHTWQVSLSSLARVSARDLSTGTTAY